MQTTPYNYSHKHRHIKLWHEWYYLVPTVLKSEKKSCREYLRLFFDLVPPARPASEPIGRFTPALNTQNRSPVGLTVPGQPTESLNTHNR